MSSPSYTLSAMLVLALDSGSPRVSVALADLEWGGAEAAPASPAISPPLVAARDEIVERSSTRLLQLIHEVLEEANLRPADLQGLIALAGPGSFTGLRIGLATAYGLHQALRLPAVAFPTLRVLAACAPPEFARAIGAVDALRGEWTVQPFRTGAAAVELGPSETLTPAALGRFTPGCAIGFGLGAVSSQPTWPAGLAAIEPGPLAPVALRLAAAERPAWDPLSLTRPLYARPPAATLPKPRPSARSAG